jgi:FKBP-type peptidyl-prolyl cis-trans isomerase 2
MATKKTAAKSTATKTTAKKTAAKKTTKKTTRKKTTTAQAGSLVELHYKGTFTDGTQFDSSYDRGETISVQVGQGQLIKGFENALIGMKKGQTKSITLSPDEAYGQSNPEAFSTVQREQFPNDYMFVEGQPVQGATEDGRPIFATISSFTETDVVLDLNHPLAGKELKFDIELTNILTDPDSETVAE